MTHPQLIYLGLWNRGIVTCTKRQITLGKGNSVEKAFPFSLHCRLYNALHLHLYRAFVTAVVTAAGWSNVQIWRWTTSLIPLGSPTIPLRTPIFNPSYPVLTPRTQTSVNKWSALLSTLYLAILRWHKENEGFKQNHKTYKLIRRRIRDP